MSTSTAARTETLCDRCGGVAVREVRCYQGCDHSQCATCADQTVIEAINEATYDKEADRG